jgi:Rieske 2Fe-2S family protein
MIGGASFGGYDLSDMKLAATKAHEIRANWKIIVENNLECYHCAINHPELCEVFDWRYNATDDFDGALAIRATGYEVLEASYPSSPHTLNGERVCAVPSPRRDNDSDPASYALMWEPGAVLSLSRDNGWIFAPRPISPDRTELRQYWFVAKDAQEGRDYDVQSLMRFWDITMMQDREICEGVQRGMEMPAYTPGPLNRIHQSGQGGFYAWYVEEIRKRFPHEVHFRCPSASAAEKSAGLPVVAGAVAIGG